MHALVLTEVDPVARALDAVDKRVDKLRLVAGKREDRAVVVMIDVHIEHAGATSERSPQRLDRLH